MEKVQNIIRKLFGSVKFIPYLKDEVMRALILATSRFVQETGLRGLSQAAAIEMLTSRNSTTQHNLNSEGDD